MTIFVAVEHGASEITVCNWISKQLKLQIVPVSKNKGQETICMKETGEFMCNGAFKNLNSLNRYYKEFRRGKISNKLSMSDISIFVIMDVDGDRKSLNSFRSKDMFRSSEFYDCIHPIVNDPNMDDIFRAAGLKITETNKSESYKEALDSIGTIEKFLELFKELDTDIPKMIKEMMSHSPDFQHKR